jgi:hypothetical protein
MRRSRVRFTLRRLLGAGVAVTLLTLAAPLRAEDEIPLATATKLLKLPGRSDENSFITLSGDGRRVALAGDGLGYKRHNPRTVILDVATGRELRVTVGRGIYLTALALSHDGRKLATGGPARRVRVFRGTPQGGSSSSFPEGVLVEVWDVDSGEILRTIETDNSPHELAFSPDGRRLLAISGSRYNLSVWDLESGAEVFGAPAKDRDQFPLGGFGPVSFPYGIFSRSRAFAVSPNPESPHKDKGLGTVQRVWDVAGRQSRNFFDTGQPHPLIRAIDDRGRRVVGREYRVVDTITGLVAFRLQPEPCGDEWPGHSYAMTWDEPRHWIIGGGDMVGTVRIWDDRTGRLLTHVKASPDKPVRAVYSTPEGIMAVTGGWYTAISPSKIEFDASPVLWKITPPETP